MRNLDVLEPVISEEVESPVNLKVAQQQLETARVSLLHWELLYKCKKLISGVQECTSLLNSNYTLEMEINPTNCFIHSVRDLFSSN